MNQLYPLHKVRKLIVGLAAGDYDLFHEVC